jgi:hypothetical protein
MPKLSSLRPARIGPILAMATSRSPVCVFLATSFFATSLFATALLATALLAIAFLATPACRLLSSSPPPPRESMERSMREAVSIGQSFSYAAGDVLAGQPLRHVFRYRNDSSTTLKRLEDQSIQTTCGCTRVRLNPQRLAPGESAELSIEIDTDNRLGEVSESATVTWYSDSAEPQHCQFTLSGRVMSAFALEPAELTFSKRDLRDGKRKTVRCRSDLPIDWQHMQVESDEPYVLVDLLQVDANSNSLVFSVGCLPTHEGDHRQTAIRLTGSTHQGLAEGTETFRAMLPVFSHDFAALRISPLIPVFTRTANRHAWTGYVILTGDLIEAGSQLRRTVAERCTVEFETLALGPAAQRVNLTLQGPVESLQEDQRQLQLTFDKGLRQSVAFRLDDH